MKGSSVTVAPLRFVWSIALIALATPASAQWARVDDVPSTTIYTVSVQGDTILAGADSTVYVSTDAGVTWKGSAKVAAGVASVQAVRVRNGRLYAGTFGQGVFISDNLGDSWSAFNQGLTGGFADSQLFIDDLLIRGDNLYAATAGDGAWVRSLTSGSWGRFGNEFEPNQAANVNAITTNGTRLFACAGGNGSIFIRDDGDPDWTISWLDNVGLHPGVQATMSIWTGFRVVVGTNKYVFYSSTGEPPWTLVDVGLGALNNAVFAVRPPVLFASFVTAQAAIVEFSNDNGATWLPLDTLPFTFVFKMAVEGGDLYAARNDGLWRRPVATVATTPATLGNIKALYRSHGK